MGLFDENIDLQIDKNIIDNYLLGSNLIYRGRYAFVIDTDENGIKTVATFVTGYDKDTCRTKITFRKGELQKFITDKYFYQGYDFAGHEWKLPYTYDYKKLFGRNYSQLKGNRKYKIFARNYINSDLAINQIKTNRLINETLTHPIYVWTHTGSHVDSRSKYFSIYRLFDRDIIENEEDDSEYEPYWRLNDDDYQIISKITSDSHVYRFPIVLIQPYNKEYHEFI